MKTVKVSEATNEQLDYLVAQCEGKRFGWRDRILDASELDLINGIAHSMIQRYSPSTNWSQMGPIIDREKIDTFYAESTKDYCSSNRNRAAKGSTYLIAAARCHVMSKIGDTVQVPEELN